MIASVTLQGQTRILRVCAARQSPLGGANEAAGTQGWITEPRRFRAAVHPNCRGRQSRCPASAGPPALAMGAGAVFHDFNSRVEPRRPRTGIGNRAEPDHSLPGGSVPTVRGWQRFTRAALIADDNRLTEPAAQRQRSTLISISRSLRMLPSWRSSQPAASTRHPRLSALSRRSPDPHNS